MHDTSRRSGSTGQPPLRTPQPVPDRRPTMPPRVRHARSRMRMLARPAIASFRGLEHGGRSLRAREGDDDELDLHGYTTGTHQPRKRPIRTNADSHTEAREFGTPVDCQRRSTTADAPSGGGSAGSNPVGGTHVMSRDIVGRCIETSLHFRVVLGGVLASADGLLVAVGVEGEVAQEFAGFGVDHADVVVGDEGQDACAGVMTAQADVSERAVVADGDEARPRGSRARQQRDIGRASARIASSQMSAALPFRRTARGRRDEVSSPCYRCEGVVVPGVMLPGQSL